MAVKALLHRNVLLLNQVIPPSDDFKKHFREGMFDKPNTAGFLHVTHYLLTVYDAERFKKLVEWPVTCKKIEAKYRNNVKDYLIIISAENTDINFPNILASHLLHAGGNKFTMIMWKLSQVAVRTYIKRETTYNVLSTPQTGVQRSLGKTFLKEANKKLNHSIMNLHKDLSSMEAIAKTALEKESETLAKIRTEIFEKEQLVINLTSDAPINSSIKKRLMDIHDGEIIQMWKTKINKDLNYIQKKNRILRDMAHLNSKVNTILNNTNVKILDGKQLKMLDSTTVSELFPPDVQCLLFHLYKNDQLELNTFFRLFDSVLILLQQQLKLNPIKEISQHLTQIETNCQDMKLALHYFQMFLVDVLKSSSEVQTVLNEKNAVQTYDDSVLPVMHNVLLMPSPLIKIDLNYSDNKNDLEKRLQLTPVEATHKSLFLRYKCLNQDKCESKVRGNLFISRINFDDVMSTSKDEKLSACSRLTTTPKKNSSYNRQAGKYSRLFSKRVKVNNRAANTSVMSIPCSSKANSTAITNAIDEIHNISELSLDMTVKSLCNTSGEFAMSENLPTKDSRTCESTSEINDVVNDYLYKPSIPIINEIKISEATKVEITSNCEKGTIKTERTQRRRSSIGDLVDRYKKILERSNRTPSPKINYLKHDNE